MDSSVSAKRFALQWPLRPNALVSSLVLGAARERSVEAAYDYTPNRVPQLQTSCRPPSQQARNGPHSLPLVRTRSSVAQHVRTQGPQQVLPAQL